MQVAKILSKVDNNMEKELYIEKISKEYGISKEAIYGEVNKLAYNNVRTNKVLERAPIKNFIKNENNQKVDEAIIKREKMVIYILINYPDVSFNAIKDIITVDNIKNDINKTIIQKIYEQYSKGNITNVINLFEDQDVVNYLSGIMADDFGIQDINKCIEDLINIYNKERLIDTRNSIIKKLEDTSNMTQEEIKTLELNLNDVILKLAKVK